MPIQSRRIMELLTSLTALTCLTMTRFGTDIPSLGALVRSLSQLQSLELSASGFRVMHTHLPPMLTSLRMQGVFCFPDLAQQWQQEPHNIQDLELIGSFSPSKALPAHAMEYYFCCGARPLRSLKIKPMLLDDACQHLVANQLTQLEVAFVHGVHWSVCAYRHVLLSVLVCMFAIYFTPISSSVLLTVFFSSHCICVEGALSSV